MDDQHNSDHLSSSLTDLMTSLMVIFILLLLVFISHAASKNVVVTDEILKALQTELRPQGFSETSIRPDPHDRNAILVIVPGDLMNFKLQSPDLQPGGELFLHRYIPALANVLCSNEFRASVESIVVEGHTDTAAWAGVSKEESQEKNLTLSQERSMAVVEAALADLNSNEHECFLEKLSATGRGEQDQESTPAESRRVIFRIRVKADVEEDMTQRLAQ